MAEILIIKLSALGDLVQADGALRDIREHHPGDTVTVMTIPAYRRYFERCPWADEVFVDPRAPRYNPLQMLDLRKRLHRCRFDRVYDLQQVSRTRFYHRFLFPPVWWLGDAAGCACCLKRPQNSCAADHFKRHLALAGIATTHTLNGDISWMADDVDSVLERGGVKTGYVLLIPGASPDHQHKCWPRFKELAGKLIEQGLQPVTVPGPGEIEVYRALPGITLVDGSGCLDYFGLAGVARRAAYVIGNDTGPTHIAAHLGCRGLALFSAHAAAQSTGIQHSRFRWLEAADLGDLPLERVWRTVRADMSGGA